MAIEAVDPTRIVGLPGPALVFLYLGNFREMWLLFEDVARCVVKSAPAAAAGGRVTQIIGDLFF